MTKALLWAAVGTGVTFGMTSLGSAMVFLLRKRPARGCSGSFWLCGRCDDRGQHVVPAHPGHRAAEEAGLPGWFPAAGGSVLGVLFLVTMNTLLPHLTPALSPGPP